MTTFFRFSSLNEVAVLTPPGSLGFPRLKTECVKRSQVCLGPVSGKNRWCLLSTVQGRDLADLRLPERRVCFGDSEACGPHHSPTEPSVGVIYLSLLSVLLTWLPGVLFGIFPEAPDAREG